MAQLKPGLDDSDLNGKDLANSDLNGKDYAAGFGEAGALSNCGTLGLQADFAYYDHKLDSDVDIGVGPFTDLADKDAANTHVGGAIFGRGEAGLIGFSGSWVNVNHILGTNEDLYRIGLVGEHHLSDRMTLGASVHYFDGEFEGKDHNGMEYSAFASLYANDNLSLKVQADLLNASWEDLGDVDGWAIGGEVEHQLSSGQFSIFAGGRFASRDYNEVFNVEDTQGFIGLRIALGASQPSLIARDRQGVINNTSTFLEKLPNDITSVIASAIVLSQDD